MISKEEIEQIEKDLEILDILKKVIKLDDELLARIENDSDYNLVKEWLEK